MATIEEQRLQALEAAADLAARRQQSLQGGPTRANATALEMQRVMDRQAGDTTRAPSDVEALMTAQARNQGAPTSMVYDSRTGQMVDTALAAERQDQGGVATALMAAPLVGEFADNAMGAVSEAALDQNPEIAAETMRQSRNQFREANPIGAPALEIATGIAGAAPLAALGAGSKALTLGQRVKRGVAIGAGAGAIEGGLAGAGAADYGGRLQGAANGALFGGLAGGILGGAADLTAAGISRAYRRIKSGRAPTPPLISDLADAKNAAYQAVDNAGFVVPAGDFDTMFDDVTRRLDRLDYNPGADPQIAAIMSSLEKNWGGDMPLSQLDRLRQMVWRRTARVDDQQNRLGMAIISSIDDVMDRVGDSQMMASARMANAQYRKAQALDAAYQWAKDSTGATGSGGNILNNMRQAIRRIVRSPQQSRFFNDDEIALMRGYIQGDTLENALRRVGKLSPNGNGLMMALNLGAVAVDPTMMAITAGATGAKALADRSGERGFTQLRNAVSTGAIPQASQNAGIGNATRAAIGINAARTATDLSGGALDQPGPTTARQRAAELVADGIGDPVKIREILAQEGFLR